MLKSPRARVFLFCAAAIASLAVLVWFLQKRSGHYDPKVVDVQNGHSSAAALANRVPATPPIPVTPTPGPAAMSPPQLSASPSPLPSESPDKLLPPIGFIGTLKLIVP